MPCWMIYLEEHIIIISIKMLSWQPFATSDIAPFSDQGSNEIQLETKETVVPDITPSSDQRNTDVQHILMNNYNPNLSVTEESRKVLKEAKKLIKTESDFRNNNILFNIPGFNLLNDEQLKQLRNLICARLGQLDKRTFSGDGHYKSL